MRIVSPIPAAHLPAAAELWWRSFGRAARPLGWRSRSLPPARAAQGVVALADDGSVAAVAGLRDSGGGFVHTPPRPLDRLFRPAPPTADLVIDGIAVPPRLQRQGAGRALVMAARDRAAAQGRPGLRVEVSARNRGAVAFWRALGFAEVGRGRYGWPWGGVVVVMRRDV